MARYEDLMKSVSSPDNNGTACSLPYDPKDKTRNVDNYIDVFINRLMAIGKFRNLPEHIDEEMLLLTIITRGHVGWIAHKGKLWPLPGNFGPTAKGSVYPTTPQGRPTGYIITNTPLGIAGKIYTIDDDCVITRSDPLAMGFLPIIERYATMLAENDISLCNVDVLMRALYIISCMDDTEAKGADKFISDIKAGELSYLSDNDFMDKLAVNPGSNAGSNQVLKALIEYGQYLKASCFMDIGLNANWNSKREAINESEAALNDDALLPLIDVFKNCIDTSLEKVNKTFSELCTEGDISFELASSWQIMREEVQISLEPEDTSGGNPKLDDSGNMATDGDGGSESSVDE